MATRSLGWLAWFALVTGVLLVLDPGHAAEQKAGAKDSGGVNLDGLWRGFVVNGRGENPNAGQTHLELLIRGNQIMARRLDGGGGPLGQGIYKMTPGKVIQMDAMGAVGGAGRPKTYLGICEVGNDTLKWCVSNPGGRRPAQYETKGQQFLLMLRRVQ